MRDEIQRGVTGSDPWSSPDVFIYILLERFTAFNVLWSGAVAKVGVRGYGHLISFRFNLCIIVMIKYLV